MHWLLREKGSYQQLARDSGAIPAIVKMERRESTKELLHWLVRLRCCCRSHFAWSLSHVHTNLLVCHQPAAASADV